MRPLVFDFMRLRVARECNNPAASWYLRVCCFQEMTGVVNHLTGQAVLNDECIVHEHLQVMVESHQHFHQMIVILDQSCIQHIAAIAPEEYHA